MHIIFMTFFSWRIFNWKTLSKCFKSRRWRASWKKTWELLCAVFSSMGMTRTAWGQVCEPVFREFDRFFVCRTNFGGRIRKFVARGQRIDPYHDSSQGKDGSRMTVYQGNYLACYIGYRVIDCYTTNEKKIRESLLANPAVSCRLIRDRNFVIMF